MASKGWAQSTKEGTVHLRDHPASFQVDIIWRTVTAIIELTEECTEREGWQAVVHEGMKILKITADIEHLSIQGLKPRLRTMAARVKTYLESQEKQISDARRFVLPFAR